MDRRVYLDEPLPGLLLEAQQQDLAAMGNRVARVVDIQADIQPVRGLGGSADPMQGKSNLLLEHQVQLWIVENIENSKQDGNQKPSYDASDDVRHGIRPIHYYHFIVGTLWGLIKVMEKNAQ